jgi:hypothetical protein
MRESSRPSCKGAFDGETKALERTQKGYHR